MCLKLHRMAGTLLDTFGLYPHSKKTNWHRNHCQLAIPPRKHSVEVFFPGTCFHIPRSRSDFGRCCRSASTQIRKLLGLSAGAEIWGGGFRAPGNVQRISPCDRGMVILRAWQLPSIVKTAHLTLFHGLQTAGAPAMDLACPPLLPPCPGKDCVLLRRVLHIRRDLQP